MGMDEDHTLRTANLGPLISLPHDFLVRVQGAACAGRKDHLGTRFRILPGCCNQEWFILGCTPTYTMAVNSAEGGSEQACPNDDHGLLDFVSSQLSLEYWVTAVGCETAGAAQTKRQSTLLLLPVAPDQLGASEQNWGAHRML